VYPTPRGAPRTRLKPDQFFDAPPKGKPDIPGFLDPVPDLGPVPKEDLDRCGCKKPKKRKPAKDREVCWKGTYTEHRKGLTKVRREKVPCA